MLDIGRSGAASELGQFCVSHSASAAHTAVTSDAAIGTLARGRTSDFAESHPGLRVFSVILQYTYDSVSLDSARGDLQ
jgi:hypothetical protein